MRITTCRADLRKMAETFCADHRLAWREFVGPEKFFAIAQPRHQFMAQAYATGRFSMPEIGALLNRDHTTVLHGIRRHRERSSGCKLSPPGHPLLRLTSSP